MDQSLLAPSNFSSTFFLLIFEVVFREVPLLVTARCSLCKYPADSTHIHWHLPNEEFTAICYAQWSFLWVRGGGIKLIDLAWNSTNLLELMLECSLQISCREHTVIDTCLMRVVAGNLHSGLLRNWGNWLKTYITEEPKLLVKVKNCPYCLW